MSGGSPARPWTDLRVRVARAADLPRLVEIHNQAIAERTTADLDPFRPEERRAWFDAHPPERRPILVAETVDGAVAGWCSLSDHRPGRAALRSTAEISYFVDRAHRRRGVASALVEEALRRAPALGLRRLFALLLAENAASVALLERHGFAPWGRLPGVAEIDGRRVDQVLYGRAVGPEPEPEPAP